MAGLTPGHQVTLLSLVSVTWRTNLTVAVTLRGGVDGYVKVRTGSGGGLGTSLTVAVTWAGKVNGCGKVRHL